MSTCEQPLKIGALNFVNALPFFHGIETQLATATPNAFECTYGSPKEINHLLEAGLLDTALISSASYLDNRSNYLLLSPLAIASEDEILSVRLYFKGELEALHEQNVYVPWCSETSTALLKILCQQIWKIQPQFIESTITPQELAKCAQAFLAIGDDCLQIEMLTGFSYIDLGRAWREWTEKPFIFALFATRVESFKTKKPLLKILFRVLEAQLKQFEQDPSAVVSVAADRLSCSPHLIRHYYRLIDYRIHEEHFSGLERYALLRQ